MHKAGFIAAGLVLAASAGCSNREIRKENQRIADMDARPFANAVHQSERDWAWVTQVGWRLTTLEGESPVPGTALSIDFAGRNWVNGWAGCNRYFASYERRGTDGLQLDSIGSTRAFCPDPRGIMQQESRFLYLLEQINSYQAGAGKLELLTDSIVVLTFESLD